MIRFRHARLAFFPTAFWAIGLLAGAQTTWHVDVSAPGSGDGSPGSPFTSIQAGIDATVDGDTVLVAPGNYLESIDFFDKAITVRSAAGPERTAILPPDAFQDSLVRILGPNIPLGTLEGFTVAGNDFVSGSQGSKGILSERGVIRRCIVRENYFGISNPYDTYVHESTVVQNAGGGMVGGGLSIHYVFNSIVDSILANAFAPSSFISYSNFSYSGGPEINGTGNIDADPQFWGEACNDFHLQAGSP